MRTTVNASDVDKFLNLLEANSVDFNLLGFDSDCVDHFYHDGNLLDVEIDEDKVKQFIKKYQSSFDMLGDEYMKKIHSIEK